VKKFIQKHLRHLENEHKTYKKMLTVYPENSFGYRLINLNLKFLEFKINTWKSLI